MIIFDVGANDGSSSRNWVLDPNVTVYAFEPNDILFNQLVEISRAYPNYKPYKLAVSDYNGVATFNVCDKADRGCSSLLDLSEGGKTEWGGRQDMFPVDKITVEVIRLDQFIEAHGIDKIDYFHCDAQGSDLKVLQGMGEHIHKITEGCVEAAAKPDILYVGQNSLKDTLDYLMDKGFNILNVHSNDVQNNEVNVAFRRR